MGVTITQQISGHSIGSAKTPSLQDIVEAIQQLANNAAALAGDTFTGSVSFAQHIHGTSTTVTATASAGAGGSPPAPVVTTGSTDLGGTITWGTGTSPNTQTQMTIAFARAWTIPGGGGPHVTVTPINAATQALGLYVSGISPTGFNVNVANAPTASQGNTTYQFCYSVMG